MGVYKTDKGKHLKEVKKKKKSTLPQTRGRCWCSARFSWIPYRQSAPLSLFRGLTTIIGFALSICSKKLDVPRS